MFENLRYFLRAVLQLPAIPKVSPDNSVRRPKYNSNCTSQFNERTYDDKYSFLDPSLAPHMRLTGPKSFHDRNTRKDIAGDDGGESKEGKGRGAVSAASDDANTAAAGECAVTATSLLDLRTPNDHALKEVLGFVPGDDFYAVRHSGPRLKELVDDHTKVSPGRGAGSSVAC